MIKNNNDITYLRGVGEKKAKMYAKLGIGTIEDLLCYYPKDYIDFTDLKNICEIEDGESCAFKGTVTKKLRPHIGRVAVYQVAVSDGTDDMLVTFFNNHFSYDNMVVGQCYLFYGKVNSDFAMKQTASPLFIAENAEHAIMPKYSLTKGLSSNMIAANVRTALASCETEELLPEYLSEAAGLMSIREAVRNIHFPESMERQREAKRRLVFEELLVLQLGLSMLKSKNKSKSGVKAAAVDMEPFYGSLPFAPTGAQKRAVEECIGDMLGELPMNRLLQGDVGSGKTLVAAAMMYFMAQNGYQSSLMAPTEILAKQHRDTLAGFLEPLGISVELLTGSMTAKEKNEAKKRIKGGEVQVVVGTHALIQKDVEFAGLGLTVTDEQHRFGVAQRAELQAKGQCPHSLVMSATPIPRTLALMIYADLDISVLDEMPKGRLPIRTYGVDSSFHQRLYRFIIKYVKEGYQAYIVCPLIEEGASEKTAATAYFEELKSGYFAGISVGLLHGKMKQAEKDAVMTDFKANRVSVLISTTVIEVGVDVPNAVVMIIENAEQFGLSQLHQLRGRVGRGNTQSHCILVSDSKSAYTKARIDTMVATCNGFEIADKDLELRGPGDFFGYAQHGLPPMKIANMTEDMETIREVQRYSAEILKDDPKLTREKNKGLRTLTARLFRGGDNFGYN
ncbi:MAG: ATP-dependent DNA helicase RecG [Oscillospiraceae bacterium]|nr:ATP-dependent DNA helicase RecG [Oscillospiraceae bacterium]